VLLNWLVHFDPIAPNKTIAALKAAVQDPGLEEQIDAIEKALVAQSQPRP